MQCPMQGRRGEGECARSAERWCGGPPPFLVLRRRSARLPDSLPTSASASSSLSLTMEGLGDYGSSSEEDEEPLSVSPAGETEKQT
jgi:hypothetical protein